MRQHTAGPGRPRQCNTAQWRRVPGHRAARDICDTARAHGLDARRIVYWPRTTPRAEAWAALDAMPVEGGEGKPWVRCHTAEHWAWALADGWVCAMLTA